MWSVAFWPFRAAQNTLARGRPDVVNRSHRKGARAAHVRREQPTKQLIHAYVLG